MTAPENLLGPLPPSPPWGSIMRSSAFSWHELSVRQVTQCQIWTGHEEVANQLVHEQVSQGVKLCR